MVLRLSYEVVDFDLEESGIWLICQEGTGRRLFLASWVGSSLFGSPLVWLQYKDNKRASLLR